MLEEYVELDRSREELMSDGFDREVVERALAMIDRAEYKRRQAPPGVKLRPKAFGRDRRTPITNAARLRFWGRSTSPARGEDLAARDERGASEVLAPLDT